MQKYEVMSTIGEGAYGVVMKCRDTQSKGIVAVKKFKQTDDDELTRKTTTREIKILKMLDHHNIVKMKQAFRKKGIVYLVFEYVENNLLEILEKSPNGLHPNLIRKLMFQLLQGLVHLHKLNLIHRDIKPENLLISSQNEVKICDFGFARHVPSEKGREEMTDYVATRWYRSPELLVGGIYGKEIDIWSVGCIMCELLDGNPLFPGENQLDQLFLIQKTLGFLPSQLNERFVKNQRFIGTKFHDIQTFDTIEKKYYGKIDAKGLSLIKSILKMDPSQRITAEEALQHPYFDCEIEKRNARLTSKGREVYSSAHSGKKEKKFQLNESKYGKIYNKRVTNFNIADIYRSSNTQKASSKQSKSLGREGKITTKTEEKVHIFERESNQARKTMNSTANWQSTVELPLLLLNEQNRKKFNSKHRNSKKVATRIKK